MRGLKRGDLASERALLLLHGTADDVVRPYNSRNLERAVADSDILICSTTAPQTVIDKGDGRRLSIRGVGVYHEGDSMIQYLPENRKAFYPARQTLSVRVPIFR